MNTIIKSISTITGKETVASNLPLRKKLKLLDKHINLSKYHVLGFVDRSNDVILQPRYYNIRNELGQFATVN